MQTLLPELYVAAVALMGFGIGLYLQSRLENTKQNVALPSPFKERWVVQEIHATA
jgi:hypothetical protein